MEDKENTWQNKVTPRLFGYCISEVRYYNTSEEYADAIIKVSIWDEEKVSRDGRKEWLKSVWDAYHRSLADVLKYTGMSQAAFYRYFGIPRRTFQDWLYGVNGIPSYTLFMMQEILGLVTRF